MSSIQTPLGPLRDLDLDSPEACFKILSYDKHQIAEGMVVESLFDQIISRLPVVMGEHDVHLIDAETFVVRDPSNFNKLYAFVWFRSNGPGQGRYLIALERRFSVCRIGLNEDGSDFIGCRIVGGKRSGALLPLAELFASMGVPRSGDYAVDHSVRSSDRQLGAFWGYLREAYGDRLKSHVALPRVLVNWGIQPYFRNVWNIDRVIVVGSQIWAVEAKHKFPFRRNNALHFGLNNGEAYLLRDLVNCGIGVLHAVVVKPYWDMNIGSSYLLANYGARERALVVGMLMDADILDSILRSSSRSSPNHTSVTGSSELKFKNLPVAWFTALANLSLPSEAAEKIGLLLEGKLTGRCTDDFLESHRMFVNNGRE